MNIGIGIGLPFTRKAGGGAGAPDLTAPVDLAAVAISDTEIDLTWTDSAPDADGWKIERSPAGAGTWVEIDDIAAPATGYSDTGLAPVTEYDYRVRAYAGVTNGSYSNTATAETEATPGGQSALYQSLVAYWDLDEVSGTREDDIGSSDLTDVNTVTSASAKQSNGAVFDKANNEALTRASSAALQAGDISFGFFGWVNFAAVAGDNYIVSKDSASAGKREYILGLNGTPRMQFGVFTATDSQKNAIWGSASSTATWYFFVAWHDATADTVNISIDNGTPVSAATGGALQAASDATFALGATAYDITVYDASCTLDEVGYFKGYVPDADDRTFLYNAGAGRTLADIFNYAG